MSDSSALREAIHASAPAEVRRDPSRPAPLSAEALGRVGHVCNWRIVVEPYIPKYQGAIAVDAGRVQEAEEVNTTVGRVLQLGCFAWKSKTGSGLDLAT